MSTQKTHSNYQKSILENVEKGTGHTAVIAVAGSGKTTTCTESMELINPIYSSSFVAFSNTVKNSLLEKTKHMRNITVSTYNALGWGICRKAFGWITLMGTKQNPDDKTHVILREKMGGNLDNKEDRDFYYKYRGIMKRLVGLSKANCVLNEHDAVAGLDALVDHHAIDIPEGIRGRFWNLFEEVYKSEIRMTKMISFDDQLFMPIKYDLVIPQIDRLFVDEWQDTSLIQYELVKRAVAGCRGRVIAIGDPMQSIFGFRGAFYGITDLFVKEMKATQLPLYICYRCPKAVIREAQQYVPYIEAFGGQKEGCVDEIPGNSWRGLVGVNDLVLCRMNSPNIRSCLGFIQEGKAAYVLGKEVGDSLEDLIDKILEDRSSNLDCAQFNILLSNYKVRKMEEYQRLDKDILAELLEDQVDCLVALMEGCGLVVDLKRKIQVVFKDGKSSGVCHMSIHKSKGLETESNGNVFWIKHRMKPSKRSWMAEEEVRLRYVATTRTRNNLYHVSLD